MGGFRGAQVPLPWLGVYLGGSQVPMPSLRVI